MKRNALIILTFLVMAAAPLNAQVFPNQSCETAEGVCESREYLHNLIGNTEYCTQPLFYYFHLNVPTSNMLYFNSYTGGGSLTFYRLPHSGISPQACDQLELGAATLVGAGTFDPFQPININFFQPGLYVLKLTFNQCTEINEFEEAIAYMISLNHFNNITCTQPPYIQPDLDCEDCITSFSPTAGKYMMSSWVKEEGAPMNTTTYSNASIGVSFTGDGSTFSLPPSGRIIDGWQRIEGIIDIPTGATHIHLSFETAAGTAYFDDVRFYPLDGSMISYVYDPINLRLMAQLDERNYATFYEYDEEGKLIRVKKETERGVMTIQENRDNIKKQ